MGQPHIIMNPRVQEYYRDTFVLMKDELNKPNGFNEIYILTPADVANAHLDNSRTMGMPLLQQGQMMDRLHDGSPEYSKFFTGLMQGLSKEPGKFPADSAVSMLIDHKEGEPPYKVGFIFVPDKPHDWQELAPQGLKYKSTTTLKEQSYTEGDDFKRFIVMPHEMGHLLDHNDRNSFAIRTTKPMAENMSARASMGTLGVRENEIAADTYAESIFNRAISSGLTSNPHISQRHFDFRVLDGVDRTIVGGVSHTHLTTPFMPGRSFSDVPRTEYDEAAQRLAQGMRADLAGSMGQHVVRTNEGESPGGNSIWDRNIRTCFNNAVTDSYLHNNLGLSSRMDNSGPSETRPRRGISETFEACMLGDFSNRYKIVVERHAQSAPDSPEGRIADMYKDAGGSLPERETQDPAGIPAPPERKLGMSRLTPG